MRILIVMSQDNADVGGSLRVGQSLANALTAQGVECEIAFAYGEAGPVASQSALPCRFVRARSSRDAKGLRRFRAMVRASKPDVVHFVTPLLGMNLATVGLPVRRVTHVHGGWWRPDLGLRERTFWRLVRARTDRFVCITHGARDALVRQGFAAPNQTEVLYNAVDVPWLDARPSREAAREALGIPRDALVAGMVCRLLDVRGVDELIRLLPLLPPRWIGLVAGDGEDRARLTRLSEELGVADRVRLVGTMADPRAAYAAMDAFLFLARYDSFGLAIAEAMACGVPVVGLEGRGEFAEPQNPLVTAQNSVLLARSDPDAFWTPEPPEVLAKLASVVREVGENPTASRSQAAVARSWVASRFSLPVQGRAALELYRRLLADARSGAML